MNQQAALHPTTRTVLQDMYSADKLYGTESAEPLPLDGISTTHFYQGAEIHALMAPSLYQTITRSGHGVWLLYGLDDRRCFERLSHRKNRW
jgi:hypothetical protein